MKIFYQTIKNDTFVSNRVFERFLGKRDQVNTLTTLTLTELA